MVNWGIIGLGNIADQFASAFQQIQNAKLVGISSRTEKNLNQFKDKYNLEKKNCFNNYQELIDSENIDVIYIALPHNFHFEWILKCLKSNKKVLTEKPATVNKDQMQQIINFLDKNKLFFAEGFMYRFHPQTSEIVKIIKDGTIGDLLSMESFFGVNIIMKRNIFGFKRIKIDEKRRLFNKKLAGGCILDLGCYPTSMSLLISDLKNKIETPVIIKNKKVEIGPTLVDIDSYAELDFQNGFKSLIGSSFKKNLGKTTKISGSKGKIEVYDTWHCSASQIDLNGKSYDLKNIKYNNIFSYEIESISQSIIESKTDPEFPAMDKFNSLRNAEILEDWQNVD